MPETLFSNIVGSGVWKRVTPYLLAEEIETVNKFRYIHISSENLKVQSLLNSIEQAYGNSVTASIDTAGRIVLRDDEAGAE